MKKERISNSPKNYWFQLEFHSANKAGSDLYGCTIHFVPTIDASRKNERALIGIVRKIGKHPGISDIRSIDIESGIIDIISNLQIDWENLLKDIIAILEEFLPSVDGFKRACPEIAHGHGKICMTISNLRGAYLLALSLSKSGSIDNQHPKNIKNKGGG